MKRYILAAWFAGAVFCIPAAAQTGTEALPAAVCYVSASGDDGNGGDETAPFGTLGRAVEAAGTSGVKTIMVIGELNEASEGRTRFGRDRESVFYIGDSGDEEILIRGFDAQARLNAGGSGRRVIKIEGNARVRLENITLTGGRAVDGGGVFIEGAALTLGEGALVWRNRAAVDGGGVMVHAGTLILSGGAGISRNRAGDDGGGVYTRGGLFVLGGNSRVENNLADCGGGVCVDDGSAFTMEGRPLVIGNKAAGPQGTGGGLCVGMDSVMVVKGGAVIDNKARRGAGVYNSYGEFALRGGSVSGNIAREEGGGVCMIRGLTILDAGTVAVNRAASGGGVYAAGSYTQSEGVDIGGNTPEDVRREE